jgi:hypothetical protein
MPMRRPEEYQIQFDQAYRYLDRCGEFIAKAREAIGFTPLSANPNNCTMEEPDKGLQLRGSVDMLMLVCTLPMRKLPLPGVSKAFQEYLLNKERNLQNNPPRPGYGLGIEVTVFESDPPSEGAISKLYATLLDTKDESWTI